MALQVGLKDCLEKDHLKLSFAMNAGMFKNDFSPKGLYIENNTIINSLDTAIGEGNFYMQPNGVFGISIENTPFICKTSDFKNPTKIKFATQSGPMLLIDGQINTQFKSNSSNLFIRNGVGILPNNHIIFAISENEISFYDFANFFKNQGCKQALYLDGYVSKAYIPSQKIFQTGGELGVIIGVFEK